MPELPADQAQVEKLVRNSLQEKFTGIAGLPNVLDHAVLVTGEADFVRRFGYKNEAGGGKTEYRVLLIVFQTFEDSDAGCDDQPVYFLVYVLRLIVSLVEKRLDGTSSTDDFAALVMTLRQKVLDERRLAGYAQLRCENLAPQRSSFGQEEEETGLTAHSIDLLLKVEVTPT